METRLFPSIGAELSLLGYGCMRFPTLPDGKIDRAESERLLNRAHNAGVNYFDTGWGYHGGESEPFLGTVLSKWDRSSYFLATKLPCWLLKDPDDPERFFSRQLERCRVDYFDFYLAHSITEKNYEILNATGACDYLARQKAEGKIRRLGFSFHDRPELLERMLTEHDWDFVQLQLNYLDWDLQDAKRQYEIAAAHGLPVVVMEPVRGGALATLSEQARAVLNKADPESSIASWAVRFAASLPGVMTVLSGMTAMDQVEDNLNTMTPFRPLSDSERAVLDEALALYRSAATIPCTGCRYCMDCPAGVDIPRVFSIYNQARIKDSREDFDGSWRLLPESARPDACVGCNACVSSCPQHIDIPGRLAEIGAYSREKAE